MTAGTWALTLLLLTANALPPDLVPMNARAFKIPVNIEPSRRAEIRSLRLFVSTDQGKFWQQQADVTPDTPEFNYTAPADGVYWFMLCVVDRQGQQSPENVYTAKVSQKMLVDTTPPVLRIVSADRQGDEVVVKWEAKDENLDVDSLKLEYHTADAPAGVWTPAIVPPAPGGEARLRPGSLAAVQVRMAIKDLAENATTQTADVAAAPGAAITTARTPAPAAPPPLPAPPTPTAGPLPPSPTPFKAEANDIPSPVQPVSRSERVDAPPMLNPGAGTTSVVAGPSAGQVIARSGGPPSGGDALPSPAPAPAAGPGPSAPAATLPSLQIIKDRRVTLEYTVAKFGASGISNAELYVTRDDGRTWQLSGGTATANAGPPLPGDVRAPGAPMKQTLTVDLPGEGTYGFYLVVKSGAGLGKPPPQSGTLPQMRVEVDTTLPEADLYNPVPDPGRRDALVMRWRASDRHLGARPVTLEWAASPEGEWKVIGERDMANTGQYVWVIPPGVPPRIFFRLTVRDLAGNVAEAKTEEAQLIDLSEPEVVGIQLHPSAH